VAKPTNVKAYTIYLTPVQLRRLQSYKARAGVPVAAAIRMAIDAFLAKVKEK